MVRWTGLRLPRRARKNPSVLAAVLRKAPHTGIPKVEKGEADNRTAKC